MDSHKSLLANNGNEEGVFKPEGTEEEISVLKNEEAKSLKEDTNLSAGYAEFKSNLESYKDNALESGTGITPFKGNSSINLFKRGVLCSSTPVPPSKKLKKDFDNLSVIEEVDTSNDQDCYVTVVNIKELKEQVQQQSEKCPLEDKAVSEDDSKKLPENDDSRSTANETVLQKDEMSMIIDMPENIIPTVNEKSVALQNEELEKNNLSINIAKDMSITYRNVVDKTIDEVIVEGNFIDKVEDVINLDHEPDREKIIEKANNLKVFVSKDEAENKDNQDPEWELLKKLETDDERYKAVRKIWKNLTIPDPKENLSSFNWRKKNSLGPLKNIKIPKSLPEDDKALALNYHCTEVFDVAIQNLWNFYQGRKKGIPDQNYECALLASLKKIPKNTKNLRMDEIHSCVQERLARHQRAKEEIEAIHKFYNGLRNREENSSNLLVLTHSERKEVLDVEDSIRTARGRNQPGLKTAADNTGPLFLMNTSMCTCIAMSLWLRVCSVGPGRPYPPSSWTFSPGAEIGENPRPREPYCERPRWVPH